MIDDERQYHRVLAYVRRTSPELAERVKLYKGKRPLFQRYEIEQGIRSTLSRRVPLPSGGSLVFDYGEAFTVVDVNTGRFTGTTKKLEDTILKNNLEAAVEVVRQLRLRDIGGIIVVDFIDMASQKNRDAVLEVLQRELKKDRSKVYVVEISPLGLVEMTRKNVADGVREIMTCECPVCEGTGRVLSDESLAIDMLRNLRRVARESKSEAFRVELEDGVARALIGTGGAGLDELEHETGRAFDVVGRTDVPRDHFEVVAEGTLAEIGAEAPPCAAGRRAQPADPRAAPLRRDGRRVAPERRLRGAGRRRPALRRARQQRLRIERATRFAAQAALLDVEPARPVAPSAPAAHRRGRRGRGQGLRHPRARAPRRRAARRRGPRAPPEAPHGGRAAAREGPPAAAAAERRRRSGGGRDGSRSKATAKAADGDAESVARRRDGRAAHDRGRRGGGQEPPPARWPRPPRARRQRRHGATRERERRRRGRRERHTGRARRRPTAAVSERAPREPGAARPRQRRRRSGQRQGGGAANGAAERRPRRARARAGAPQPRRTTPPQPAARARAVGTRRAASERGRAPQGPHLAHPRALIATAPCERARRHRRQPTADSRAFAMLPFCGRCVAAFLHLANRSKALSVCRHLARRKAVPRPQGRVPDRRPPRARGRLDVLAAVLLATSGDDVLIDADDLAKVTVTARVDEHLLGPKIRVFQYKPKKSSKKARGHRSRLSRITIEEIAVGPRPRRRRPPGEGARGGEGAGRREGARRREGAGGREEGPGRRRRRPLPRRRRRPQKPPRPRSRRSRQEARGQAGGREARRRARGRAGGVSNGT